MESGIEDKGTEVLIYLIAGCIHGRGCARMVLQPNLFGLKDKWDTFGKEQEREQEQERVQEQEQEQVVLHFVIQLQLEFVLHDCSLALYCSLFGSSASVVVELLCIRCSLLVA
jgi:hypothetical protein